MYAVAKDMPGTFKIDSSPHLKNLKLTNLGITDNFVHELLPKFPVLEKLNLSFCHWLEWINISSRTLKNIIIRRCMRLLEAKIDAPNLLSFKYDRMPSLSITITSPPQQWKPVAIFYGNLKVDHLKWFGRLRNFVSSLNRPVALKVYLVGWPKNSMMGINNFNRIPLCDQSAAAAIAFLVQSHEFKFVGSDVAVVFLLSFGSRLLQLPSENLRIAAEHGNFLSWAYGPCADQGFPMLKDEGKDLKEAELPTVGNVGKNGEESPRKMGMVNNFGCVDISNHNLHTMSQNNEDIKFKAMDGGRRQNDEERRRRGLAVVLETRSCRGSKRLQVANLHNLNLVSVSDLEKVEISAPTLQIFMYAVAKGMPGTFNIDSSPHLKNLKLTNLETTDDFVRELLCKFPVLEKLNLSFCHWLKGINISSRSLKNIIIMRCRRLLEAKVNLIGWPKKTLTGINNYKGIPLCDQVPVIERLEVRAFDDLRCYESLLDCLFWTCHPTKLFLKSCNKLNKTVIEKLCEMLMEREEGPCCCSSANSKCWRHHLKDVEVGCFELKNKVERPLHWKNFIEFVAFSWRTSGDLFQIKLVTQNGLSSWTIWTTDQD
ncbi:hypothetical protein RHSIM_Rhsim04G0225400 [Rhododendron simsii]|uniref:At1g61320/AtMIF1 LRR domain-containing protein n=1 Tax=Rhododendron simsii TaxID=118357 RepID=A0A834LRF1_RHOSS|nr:hypothetical protein RHSIM_Rhsim04G0225400 [Rhododendron simsii]